MVRTVLVVRPVSLAIRDATVKLAAMVTLVHRARPVPKARLALLDPWVRPALRVIPDSRARAVLPVLRARRVLLAAAARWACLVLRALPEFAACLVRLVGPVGRGHAVNPATMVVPANKVRRVLPGFRAPPACLELLASREIAEQPDQRAAVETAVLLVLTENLGQVASLVFK